MADYSVLVSSISDVGYWRWWSERLPELFQLEFGGVEIYLPPEDRAKPPTSILALRFSRPSRISFIQRKGASDNVPADWSHRLKEDKIEPFGISYDQFALCNDALFGEIVGQIQSEAVHFTDSSGGKDVTLAFWAGTVGVIVEAEELRPVLVSGEVDLSTITQLHNDWWSYWREYWKKRGTAEALPTDSTCEVTIPLKQD